MVEDGRRVSGEVTSSGVKVLIDRLRQEGVEAGEATKSEIIAEAEREAERVVKEARAKARGIVDDAVEKAQEVEASGEDALQVAMRDAVLRMRETIRQRLAGQARRLVSKQMVDEKFLRHLIVEITRKARDETKLDQAEEIDIFLPPEVLGLDDLQQRPEERQSKLSTFAEEIVSATFREGVSVDALEPGARGLRVRLTEGEFEIDLTDQAIARLLLQHLQPRFRLVLQEMKW